MIDLKEERAKLRLVTKRYNELSKHQTNIRTILLCTNATPIRKYGGVGYMCCFCDREYPEPSLLKSHTRRLVARRLLLSSEKLSKILEALGVRGKSVKDRIRNTYIRQRTKDIKGWEALYVFNKSHDKSILSTYTATSSMANFVVKLDITDLHCTICGSPLPSVEAAADHLVTAHSQPFYKELKSHVLPFRFTGGFRCVLCVMQFSNFKVLLEHMNVHFRNHVCETCGKGYVNKVQFQTHTYRHKTGQFACSVCTKVFDTQVKCREHKRATHVLNNTRSKCGYCGERFKDYTKKREHEVLTHGATGVSLQCRACDRTFSNQRALSVHTKTYHLMERTVPK